MRPSNREANQLRNISINLHPLVNTDSCLIKLGNTHVICSATCETTVPPFLRGQQTGWLTAEYGMLPASTNQRMKRESHLGKQSGRTHEIQRLIGRSLRNAIDLKILGPRQIIIDCDVINADGGTRTAAITGGYIALHMVVHSMIKKKLLMQNPLKIQIAAISSGIYKNQPILDLDYIEDSEAEVDANFVFSSNGKIVEIQTTAEKGSFTEEQFTKMLRLSHTAASELFTLQNNALNLLSIEGK